VGMTQMFANRAYVLGLSGLLAAFLALGNPSFAGAQERSETAPAPMQGAIITSLTAEQLMVILRRAGYVTRADKDRAGRPVIRAQATTVRFNVRTFGCNQFEPRSCDRLLFEAKFALNRAPTEADVEAINQYNQTRVFGRGYLDRDENIVVVDMPVNLRDGITAANLTDNITIWSQVLDSFMRQLGWSAEG